MKATRIWLAVALVPLAAACGGGDAGSEGAATDTAGMGGTATATAPTDSAATASATPSGAEHMALGGNKISLQQVGGSGVSGEATLSAQGESTMVMVTLTNVPQGPHAGHIHSGTCESPGPVVAPLQEISVAQANGTGSSHSTVPVSMANVMNGQHIVQYHQQGGDNPGPGIVCGSIPTEQVQPGTAATGGATATDSAAKM